MGQIPVFIISLKNSPRIKKLKKRLKNIKISYKIFSGVDGNYLQKKKKLHLVYSKKLTKKNIGRELSAPEVGAAASHLSIYNYIIKKNISQAIIMEDDAFPSKFLYQWINNNIKVENNQILNFFCYPTGYIEKKPYKYIFNNSIKLHKIVGHTFGASCYQINNYTCKKIIFLTKNKVIGYPDWPFSITLNKINLSITLPLLALINDEGLSHLKEERDKKIKSNQFIKKMLPSKFIKILRIFYYFSYLPYFISKYPNKNFYYEHYVQTLITQLKNFFSNKYLQLEKVYYNKNYYFKDLKKIIKFYY